MTGHLPGRTPHGAQPEATIAHAGSTAEDVKARLFQSYVTTKQSGAVEADVSRQLRSRLPYLTWVIKRFMPADRAAVVVDLGAGYGALLHALRSQGYVHVTGVELSREMVQLGRNLGIGGLIEGDLIAACADLNASSVDVVACFDVLEHLPLPQLIETLAGARRVMRAGGVCIVQVPNGEGVLSGNIIWGDVTHERAFTRESIRQVMIASGFATVEVHEVPPVSAGLKGILRRVAWELLVAPRRLLSIIETGDRRSVVSWNLIAVARA